MFLKLQTIESRIRYTNLVSYSCNVWTSSCNIWTKLNRMYLARAAGQVFWRENLDKRYDMHQILAVASWLAIYIVHGAKANETHTRTNSWEMSVPSGKFLHIILFSYLTAIHARSAITNAMSTMERLSCLRFKSRTNEPYFVRFIRGQGWVIVNNSAYVTYESVMRQQTYKGRNESKL